MAIGRSKAGPSFRNKYNFHSARPKKFQSIAKLEKVPKVFQDQTEYDDHFLKFAYVQSLFVWYLVNNMLPKLEIFDWNTYKFLLLYVHNHQIHERKSQSSVDTGVIHVFEIK